MLQGPLWVIIHLTRYETDDITRIMTQINPIKAVASAERSEQN